VRFATPEQLSEVVGEKVAAKITEYFSSPEDLTDDAPLPDLPQADTPPPSETMTQGEI
jgi:hypothetical protein